MVANILDSFPRHLKPRDIQVDILRKIEEVWNDTDVFVVNLPTASGKSAIAITLAQYARSRHNWHTCITTPTNVLVQQYKEEYSWLGSSRRRDSYLCENKPHLNPIPKCQEVKADLKKYCSTCPYVKDLRRMRGSSISVLNNHQYLAHRLYRNLLIADEAHNLVPMRQELAARKIWADEIKLPSTVTTYRKLTNWLSWQEKSGMLKAGSKLRELWNELTSGGVPKYLVQYEPKEPYFSYTRPCLKLIPIDVSDAPNPLWPQGQVSKIILLSATIGEHDIHQLGLSRKRVTFLEAASPIPPKNRPISLPYIGSMGIASQGESLPKFVELLRTTILPKEHHKGLIHITYSMRQELQRLLEQTLTAEQYARFLWHTSSDKMRVYKEFREAPVGTSDAPGKVLMASGLYEGIDLPGDLGRWQVVTKVPWPSLGEPALKWLADSSPKRYAWETTKVMLQACGRICRDPKDYGITYVVDNTFNRLLRENPEQFPTWFTEAILAKG